MLEIFEVNNANKFIIDKLFKLHNQVFLPLDKLSKEGFISEFSLDNRIYFVAKDNNKIIGYIGVINCVDFFEIIGIGVSKEAQNKGVGTKLLQKIFEKAKELKVEKIFLEVDERNLVAQNFYKKNNFTVTSIRKNYYKSNDALIMMCSKF